MKNLISGIIVGMLLMGTTYAVVEEYICYKVEYDVVVNGEIYSDEELPTLNYQGSTYVPLRNIGDILNTKVEWNYEIGRAEVGETSEKEKLYLEYNGIKYIYMDDASTSKYEYYENYDNGKLALYNNIDKVFILDDIPYITNREMDFIEYKYYLENIFPLLEE